MGQSDNSNTKAVKMYCPKCEDLYNPKATRHASIDGAYFGTSFHNIFFQVYPHLVPTKSKERHQPRVFGFRVHAAAALARWQDQGRIEQRQRLRAAGAEDGYANDDDGEAEVQSPKVEEGEEMAEVEYEDNGEGPSAAVKVEETVDGGNAMEDV